MGKSTLDHLRAITEETTVVPQVNPLSREECRKLLDLVDAVPVCLHALREFDPFSRAAKRVHTALAALEVDRDG